MNEFIFKRVLHPVGQGAFFSEHFCDNNGSVLFNVVYDCGEMRKSKHLDVEINNTFNLTDNPDVIDIMFISHLDSDHISGIKTLVDIGCLTKKSIVVLPLHYPLVLKLVLQSFRSTRGRFLNGYYDGLNSLFDSEAKVLGIDEDTPIESNGYESEDDVFDNIPQYGKVKSMKPLNFNALWCYLPFNTILDNNIYKKFQQSLANAKINPSQLVDITYVQKNLKPLIDIYSRLPKSINGVTAINVNSLNVLSYSVKDLHLHPLWQNYAKRFFPMCHYWDMDWIDDSRCSCLYTGDCVMGNHFDRCINSLLKNTVPYIGMLQIPHHGRARNYNKTIACRGEILSGFTNFNSTYQANKFVKQIIHDFSVARKPFYQITEDFHSRWEMYVRCLK